MSGNIVAISVEKIQKYIFNKLDNREQSQQNDENTLKSIVEASESISNEILNKIEDKFQIKYKNKILWTSGKVIFKSFEEKEELGKKSKELFEDFYNSYNGKVFLNYLVIDNLEGNNIINTTLANLKKSEVKNKVIEDNYKLLFDFCEIKKEKRDNDKIKNDYSGIFASNLDDLVVLDENHFSESTNGKIAIVKADINNLGNIFSGIKCDEEYRKTSEKLNEKISFENFKKLVEDNKQLHKKILPFYIAGDDIFFAVRVSHVLNSLEILKKLVDDINKCLERGDISISVGVEFVNNHLPIRYYNEMVEKRLTVSKCNVKSLKNNEVRLGVNISDVNSSGINLYMYKKGKGKGNSNGFNKFCREIDSFIKWEDDEIFTNSSIYKLLYTLENEENKKRKFLDLLYYTLPNINGIKVDNDELNFKKYLLSLVIENRKDKNEKNFKVEKIDSDLIPRLKLIILLIKYNVENSKKGEANITKNNALIFNKPLKSLFNNLYEELDGYRDIFIKREEKIFEYQKRPVEFYKKAKFNSNVFIRAKKILENSADEAGIEKVIKLFSNYSLELKNSSYEDELLDSDYVLDFKVEEFKKLINSKGKDDLLWLDMLTLFYKYDEQKIKWKNLKIKNKLNKVIKTNKTNKRKGK